VINPNQIRPSVAKGHQGKDLNEGQPDLPLSDDEGSDGSRLNIGENEVDERLVETEP
jgi:hypothetical protein